MESESSPDQCVGAFPYLYEAHSLPISMPADFSLEVPWKMPDLILFYQRKFSRKK